MGNPSPHGDDDRSLSFNKVVSFRLQTKISTTRTLLNAIAEKSPRFQKTNQDKSISIKTLNISIKNQISTNHPYTTIIPK